MHECGEVHQFRGPRFVIETTAHEARSKLDFPPDISPPPSREEPAATIQTRARDHGRHYFELADPAG